MSSFASIDLHQALRAKAIQAAETNGGPPLPAALPFLLQPDPEAIIEVELVNRPLDLPQDQFEALLVDAECEV